MYSSSAAFYRKLTWRQNVFETLWKYFEYIKRAGRRLYRVLLTHHRPETAMECTHSNHVPYLWLLLCTHSYPNWFSLSHVCFAYLQCVCIIVCAHVGTSCHFLFFQQYPICAKDLIWVICFMHLFLTWQYMLGMALYWFHNRFFFYNISQPIRVVVKWFVVAVHYGKWMVCSLLEHSIETIKKVIHQVMQVQLTDLFSFCILK